MKCAPILVKPGANGKGFDLYGYITNELYAHKVKATVQEVGGIKGALLLLAAARKQIRSTGAPVPGHLDLAISEVARLL